MAADKMKLPPEIDQLTQKLVADPKSRVFAQLADAYRKIGMLDEAIETAKHGLEVHPTYAIGHNVLGRCYLEKKMYALASEEFQLTIKGDPQNLVAYKMLATTYEKQGISDQALKYYQMVLDLEPGEIEVAEKIEQLKAAAGDGRAALSQPPAPEPEPVPAPRQAEPEPAAAAEQQIQLESVAPSAPEMPAPAMELQIERPEEAAVPATAEPEPVFAAPAEQQEMVAPTAAAADGEATPTLAEIYAQQGHYEKAIEIYQKLISDSPGDASYKTRMDELLAKAYPDEMAQGGEPAQPEPAAEAPSPKPAAEQRSSPAEAAAEVPDKMFSQMFAEMEKVAVGKELNIPDGEPAGTAPLQLAPEPAKEDAKPEPAQPAAAPAPAAEPVNFGALFSSEEKSSLGIEPPATPPSSGAAAPGGGDEPKKDEAVSSFQSWLSSLQK